MKPSLPTAIAMAMRLPAKQMLWKVTFSTTVFGSYHGDWDYAPNPFMPSALASKGGILTCGWAGRPHWFIQHMASGETVGYSTVETQNTCDIVGYPSYYGACGTHVTLLGDPTLRAHVVAPASDFTATSQCGSVHLNWTAAADNVAGYQVFRSTSPLSGFTKINATLATGTNYIDMNPPVGNLYYQLRAVKLQTGTGGTYWNNSTGVFSNVNYIGGTTPNVTAAGGLITCYFAEDTVRGFSTTSGVSFHWDGPNGFSSEEQNAATSQIGTYVLTVTALNGCTASTTVTVIEDTALPVVMASGNPITCANYGQLLGYVSGGFPEWTGPNGFISDELSPAVTEAGTYTLTGLNIFNGCTATATVEITEDLTIPENVTALANGSINCINTSVSLQASSSTNGASFAWTGPNGFSQSGENVTTFETGDYTVVVTHPTTGCTVSETVMVTEDISSPDVSAAGGTLSCNEPSINLVANSGTSGVTFNWFGPGGFSSTEQNPSVNAAGTYELLVTASNGCTSSATVTVDIDGSVPNVSAVGGLITCYNDTDTVRGFSTTPDVTFAWTTSNGIIQSGADNQNAVAAAPGTYVLIVTAPNGCTNSTSTTVAADLVAPTVSATTPDPINCIVTDVTLQAMVTGGVPFWTGPNNFASSELNPVVSAPGIYTLTALSPLNGCTSSLTVEVADNTTPPTVTAVGGVIYCEGGTVTLTAVHGPDIVIAWPSLPGGNEPVVSDPGDYVLVATDLNTGCTATETAVVTQVSPFLSADVDPMTVNCNGSKDLSITATGGTQPYNYAWSNGETSAGTNFPNSAASYFVTLTDDAGCTLEFSGDLPFVDTLSVTATATNESAVGANDGTATASPAGGQVPVSYLWSNGSTTQTAAGLTAGNYTVTITGNDGCTAVTTVEVQVMVGTNVAPEGWNISLAPNPASQQTWLNLHFPKALDAQVRVEDLSGRNLISSNIGVQQDSRIRLDTSKLPAGLYIVRILADSKVYNMKLVKSE
ncbi:MAG: T9SS type A sorting domain-containing protein [Lewinellaceae bacterium]|nr:T9SS type A sorting domain-containing protein [Lewinellaceae bacterium]